jgi:hypothetical protein
LQSLAPLMLILVRQRRTVVARVTGKHWAPRGIFIPLKLFV